MEGLAQTKIIQVGTPLNQIRNGRTRNPSIVSIHLVDRSKDDSWAQQRASLASLPSCGSIWQVSSGKFLVTMCGVGGAICLVILGLLVLILYCWLYKYK